MSSDSYLIQPDRLSEMFLQNITPLEHHFVESIYTRQKSVMIASAPNEGFLMTCLIFS